VTHPEIVPKPARYTAAQLHDMRDRSTRASSFDSLIPAVRAGDWAALAAALAAESGEIRGDWALLHCLATGRVEDNPPPLPSYRLLRQIGAAIAPALRLADLARGFDAPRAAATLRVALAFAPDDPAILLALARLCCDRRELPEATVLARRALAADPRSAEVLTAVGWLFARAGGVDEAEKMLRDAIDLAPSHAPAHLYLGLTLHRRGQVELAEMAFYAALALDPALDDARVALGWLLDDLGRIDEALQHSERAVVRAMSPNSLLLHGSLLARANKPDAAIALLEHAVSLAPADGTIRCRLAAVMATQGRSAEAMRVLAAGLETSPDDAKLQIATAWLHRDLGQDDAAERIADAVLARDPRDGPAWQIKAALRQAANRIADAEACVVRALATQPHAAELILWRARLIRRQGRPIDAAWLVDGLLHEQPHRDDASLLRAQLDLDLKRFQEARRRLHTLLRARTALAEVWRDLGIALVGLDRLQTARYAVRRACRLAPKSVAALTLRASLDQSVGDIAGARAAAGALLALVPDDANVRVVAARIAIAAGALDDAERHAERAVMLAPELADAWYALGQLRHHQTRWRAAEDCLQLALQLAPERADLLTVLGWILVDDDRIAEAEIAFLRAAEIAPKDPTSHLALAQCRRLAGRFEAAIDAADQALRLRPGWPDGRRSRAASRIELGLQDDAAAELADLLRAAPFDREAGSAMIGLAARGGGAARMALGLIPRALRRTLHREGIESNVAHAGATELAARVVLARADFPDDMWLACAALNAAAMTGSLDADTLRRRIRAWGRSWRLSVGTAPPPRLPTGRAGARLRVAYIASVLHERLLLSVLAAHDPTAVELFLYTSQVAAAEAVLGTRVQVIRLDGDGLAESLLANRIDIVVDTVGLHPFHGQLDVLRALARRVAPVQCGWLGSWGPGGGLYDVLIADDAAIPADAEALYDETIVRLSGGQWCWTPPLHAPDPGTPPCATRGHVVFGSTVRGFRLTDATLDAWARLLARVPDARLELLGRQSRNWRLRGEIDAAMRDRGVDPARVGFQYQRHYAEHLAFFQSVDIALDAFPGNAGLGLLDALWMGVPVISCTIAANGPALAGSRQALSVLRAIGRPEWCADSVDLYIERAAALAAAPAQLATLRATLRQTMRAAPLLDGHRVAAALEAAWRELRTAAQPIAEAANAKNRSKAVAQRALSRWLARAETLVLPQVAEPTVSVIMVLFNQAGLTQQALLALADQRDVAFETLIVDNCSTDDTGPMLDRIAGAEILRNDENRHFLAAVNQAAAQAHGRYILLLNNDAVVQDGALAAAVARLDHDPTIGAVGGRIVLGDGRLQEAGCISFGDGSTIGYGRGHDPDAPEFRFVRDVDFCSGAFLMIRAPLWCALGGFDPRYAPAYYEDTDLCLRLRQAGHRVVYDPAILVGHLEWGSSTGPDAATERMRRNQSVFLARHRAALARRPAPHAANLVVERWASRPLPRLLVVDNGVPHVATGGGMPRARLMLHALDRHHVTWFPLWHSDDDWRAVEATVPAGTEVMLGHGAKRFEQFLEDRAGVYDVMLVSRPPNMAWIERLRRRRPRLFEGMRVVYDAEALFALREIAQEAVLGRPLARDEQRRRIGAEIALAGTADRVLAVSQRDADWFAAAGLRDVRIVAHGLATRRDAPGPEARRGMLFIGALDPETPNEDGLAWFVRSVMPLLPTDLVLSIIGECRSSAVAALASPRVRLLGQIDDVRPHYDAARLFIAPARFAAGVAAKVIEAACHGLPVVGSAVLARQLGWACGSEIVTARNPTEFAAGTRRLDRDDALWRRVQQRALTRAADQFNPNRFAAAVRDAVTF
jgi:GT2 family glycosyltransferase/tetratricopeptide (TPR) repeat protein